MNFVYSQQKQELYKQGIPDRNHETYIPRAQVGPDLVSSNRGGCLGAFTKQKWNPRMKLRGFSPQANSADRATAACRRS
jgi:hypothetical protein